MHTGQVVCIEYEKVTMVTLLIGDVTSIAIFPLETEIYNSPLLTVKKGFQLKNKTCIKH